VVLLMMDVVLDEEAERDRRVVANHATCVEALFGNPTDCGNENFVLGLPPAQESFPGFAGISVRGNPGVLFVAGAGVLAIDRGADNLPGKWEGKKFNLPLALFEAIPQILDHDTVIVMHNDAVVQGLSERPFMDDVEHWGVLTIGTGLGNAQFRNRGSSED